MDSTHATVDYIKHQEEHHMHLMSEEKYVYNNTVK